MIKEETILKKLKEYGWVRRTIVIRKEDRDDLKLNYALIQNKFYMLSISDMEGDKIVVCFTTPKELNAYLRMIDKVIALIGM